MVSSACRCGHPPEVLQLICVSFKHRAKCMDEVTIGIIKLMAFGKDPEIFFLHSFRTSHNKYGNSTIWLIFALILADLYYSRLNSQTGIDFSALQSFALAWKAPVSTFMECTSPKVGIPLAVSHFVGITFSAFEMLSEPLSGADFSFWVGAFHSKQRPQSLPHQGQWGPLEPGFSGSV